MPQVSIPVGLSVFEINTPTRADGARVTLTRQAWPAGNLFRFDVYERERGGALAHLAGAMVQGGNVTGQFGAVNPPMVVTLSWDPDKDKDRIRVEINALQAFTTDATVEWLT